MEIKKLSKVIHEIRKVMGYATKEQIEEGWEGEMKSVKELIEKAIKEGEVCCAGFHYIYKKGNFFVRIEPDFSFRVKVKR